MAKVSTSSVAWSQVGVPEEVAIYNGSIILQKTSKLGASEHSQHDDDGDNDDDDDDDDDNNNNNNNNNNNKTVIVRQSPTPWPKGTLQTIILPTISFGWHFLSPEWVSTWSG